MTKRRRHAWIVHAMWALGGAALGAAVALIWLGDFKPEWIEATGTWFGAIATVLTLLWAVQTFRADQAARQEALEKADNDRQREAAAAEAAIVADAARVEVTVRGGAGYGPDSDKQMTSVHLDIFNGSRHPVTIREIEFPAAVELPALMVRVPAGESWTREVKISDIPADPEELSGKRTVTRLPLAIVYALEGREWRRELDEQPIAS
ncbi:hypothetical protein ACPW96_21540 [Micromonospora sp. DT81.3]|uniref:hypothetical protein n=1 Tax=Micromonospora sp. DT81.3 TaxID=3416523 RepID=UPI003CEEFBF9